MFEDWMDGEVFIGQYGHLVSPRDTQIKKLLKVQKMSLVNFTFLI